MPWLIVPKHFIAVHEDEMEPGTRSLQGPGSSEIRHRLQCLDGIGPHCPLQVNATLMIFTRTPSE